MDFSLPTHIEPLLERIRAFVGRELIPLEAAFLNGEFRDLLPVLVEKRAQVKAAGLWAPWLPVHYGGLGLTLAEYAHISEELGRSPLGHYVFNCQAPDVGNMEILHQFGSAEQKLAWLQPLARGEIRSCFCMTEPENPGSNPTLMDTTAVKDGSDYVINGHKWFSTAADGATVAIVMAMTDPGHANRHQRASQIIVPTDTRGYRRVRNISMMGETGSDHASHAEMRLRELSRAASQSFGRGRCWFSDRPRAAWPRSHPSLHALDRHLRTRVGSHVSPRHHAAGCRRTPCSATNRPCRTGSPTAAPRSTPPA